MALIMAGVPDCLILQNPPAIPTLAVCFIFCQLTRSKYIIDWHNYGFTILSIALGNDNKLVQFSKRYEFFFGRRSDANLCVTKAMKDDLMLRDIKATVLYDRPPKSFDTISLNDKHELLVKLGKTYPELVQNCPKYESVFTQVDNGQVSLKNTRPGLLVSSTSWTEDEDFNFLLEALQGK